MSNPLNEALAQAGELLKVVNQMIPQAEKLVNAGISEATKTLKGDDLKDAQKKLMQIKKLTKDAKSGISIELQVKVLTKEVRAKYKK